VSVSKLTPSMSYVVDAADQCVGFVIWRGVSGIEGFSRDEVSLGIFDTEAKAVRAVLAAAENERGAG
jgi:hypothetical protein